MLRDHRHQVLTHAEHRVQTGLVDVEGHSQQQGLRYDMELELRHQGETVAIGKS